MSSLSRNLTVITDNRWAGSGRVLDELTKLITENGYDEDSMSGALFACWHLEFSDGIAPFKDYTISAVRVMVDITNAVVASKDLTGLDSVYKEIVDTGWRDNRYPEIIKNILNNNMQVYKPIINNSAGRIIAHNA